jgi:hypothetical protein
MKGYCLFEKPSDFASLPHSSGRFVEGCSVLVSTILLPLSRHGMCILCGPAKQAVSSNVAVCETQRSTIVSFPTKPSALALASVEDAHNQGAVVRVFGNEQTAQALYDADLQAGGVIIRPCHLVVVDCSRDPWEIIWRIGTRAIVRQLDGQMLTLDLGYRILTIPLRDGRPDSDLSTQLSVGIEVLLQGKLDEAIVSDIFIAGELAHPERLRAYLDEVIARLADGHLCCLL